jgi:hypothetical protein
VCGLVGKGSLGFVLLGWWKKFTANVRTRCAQGLRFDGQHLKSL